MKEQKIMVNFHPLSTSLLPSSTEAFGAMCAPRSRGREKRKMMCKRLQFVCQWRQRGCQSLRSPQMLKIGSLNEGLCFEEAILMERLGACFLKWLCWHEVRLHHCLCLTKRSPLVLVHSKSLSSL